MLKWLIRILAGIGAIAVVVVLVVFGFYFSHEENRDVEELAVPTESHPLAGFYKDEEEGCENPWGWAIGPAGEDKYYISFCGPGGCFEADSYRPNTSILDDEDYEVVDENTIRWVTREGWKTHVRCPSRT